MSQPKQKIGFLTACAIVIANIIGTGVFTSLGFQLADIHSGFALVMLWIVGGIVALCGALSYSELSAALPRSGGEYHFLSSIYHPALGFMAGFVSATVGFAAPIALAAMAFGQYFQGVSHVASPLALSFALVWLNALVHLSGLKVGSLFQDLSTLLKVLLIGALVAAGLLVYPKQPVSFLPQSGDAAAIFSGSFAVALVFVMYSYSGWNAAVYITSEIKRPEKNVPRALLCGTLVVLVIYTALNAIFLATTPASEMRGQVEVALIAGKHIFGEKGTGVVGGIICLGLVSAISSMTWIGPRVTMAMGEDHWLLRLLGRKNRQGIPANAILLQLLIVNLLLLTRSFELVVLYIQFSLLLCSLLAVIGVIVLRRTRPELARPYRVWAYPWPPLIFAAVTIWMMVYLLRSHPTESLSGLATMFAGFMLYFFAGKRFPSTGMKAVGVLVIAGAAWSSLVVPAAARSQPRLQGQGVPAPSVTQPAAPPPDDTAKFLAGIPIPPNSPLAPLTQTPAWQEHSAYFEEAFAKLKIQQLDKLHAFQDSSLPESKDPTPVVFYMFSGPDFLYVDQFFPNASVYVLCGKESMGPPPDPLRMSDLSGALHNLENAMYSSLHTSYFITKDMKVDLQQQNLNGTLPVLYVFLARADKTIRDVTFISLDHGAGVHESRPGTGGTPGVRIRYQDNASGRSQTMYYFTTDISDSGINSSPAFMNFCHQFGAGRSFLKSSSYLMFEGGFAKVRNFILDHSNMIVQDDSGIPVADFNEKWKLRFFGTYVGPIELFKQYNQPKLRELFVQTNPPPFGIGFGYQWNYTKSNLIVAQRP